LNKTYLPAAVKYRISHALCPISFANTKIKSEVLSCLCPRQYYIFYD